jgi:uncharacterized membrane protein
MSAQRIALAAAVFGAASLLSPAAGAHMEGDADDGTMERCFGVAEAGHNDCASASGTHDCAGQAEMDFDGAEWKLVPAGTCVAMGGSLESFEGTAAPAEPAPEEAAPASAE